MSERFGTLRALLQQAPSEQVWRELLEELGLWGEEERERVALPYVLGHLDKWPDAVERGVGRLKGEQGWMWGLANTLRSPSLEVLERIAAGEGARRVRRIETYSVEDHAGLVGKFEGLRAYSVEMYGDDYELLYKLLGARWPASLRALSLSPVHGELRGDDEPFAQQIALNPTLGGLEVLELGGMKLRAAGARALADSPHLKGLRRLDLSCNEIEEAGMRALAGSPTMEGVTELELSGEELGAGLAALVGSPHLGSLRKLVVRQGSIGLEGAQALRGVACPAALEELVVRGLYLPGEVMAALAQAPVMRAVRELNLTSSAEGWAVALLLGSEHMSGLRALHLPGGMDEEVWMALAQNEALVELGSLSVDGCALSDRVCDVLGTSALRERLHSLALYTCSGDVVRLLERGGWGALRCLVLNSYGKELVMVDDAVAVRLAACEALRGLETLSLAMNRIGDAGILALVRSPHLHPRCRLALSGSLISDAGILELADEPALGRLEGRLILDTEQISDEAWGALHDSPYARAELRSAIKRWLQRGER